MAIVMNEQPGIDAATAEVDPESLDTCLIPRSDWVKKGQLDPLGDTIDRILVGTDRFIVYSVVQGGQPGKQDASADAGDGGNQTKHTSSVTRVLSKLQRRRSDHVWLRTKYPKDYECARQLRAKLGMIAADLAYICDVVDSICRSGSLDAGSSTSLRTRATEMMARAMELAYEGNEAEAKELLAHLRKNTTTLRDSKNRMRYVQGNLLALATILALWLGLRFTDLMSNFVVKGASDSPNSFDVHALDILALGAIGAFFAVSASVSTIRVDHSVSFWEMVYTGFIRIPIGVIAAGVAIFLISGDWLLASIDDALMPWTFLLFGFLAGFSELFVPNALRQVEAASTVATQ